jgi:uncharacterized protein (DUF2249 family)
MNTTPLTTTTLTAAGVLDVREVPCQIKHPLILRTCLDLPVGESFVLLNSHHPRKVIEQIAAEWPGAFAAETLPERPDGCRVKITKLKVAAEKAALPAAPVCNH